MALTIVPPEGELAIAGRNLPGEAGCQLGSRVDRVFRGLLPNLGAAGRALVGADGAVDGSLVTGPGRRLELLLVLVAAEQPHFEVASGLGDDGVAAEAAVDSGRVVRQHGDAAELHAVALRVVEERGRVVQHRHVLGLGEARAEDGGGEGEGGEEVLHDGLTFCPTGSCLADPLGGSVLTMGRQKCRLFPFPTSTEVPCGASVSDRRKFEKNLVPQST